MVGNGMALKLNEQIRRIEKGREYGHLNTYYAFEFH
jgi:hypothetical protein